MKLHIDRHHIEPMIAKFPRLAFVQEQLRFGNRVELSFGQMQAEELDYLQGLYAQGGQELRARGAQIATLRKVLNTGGKRFEADELEMAVPAIARYLAEDSQRGWVFSASITGKPLAYVVTRLDFTPPSEEETGKIFVELKANAKARLATATVRISSPDIVGKTVAEVLAAKGFVKETPELIKSYDETVARYFEWRGQYGAQFSGSGVGYFAENPTATHRDNDYSRKDLIILSSSGGTARLVNDESILGERVLAQLLGVERARMVLNKPSILVAEDLTPSDTLQLDMKFVVGLAISSGGPTSHTAILARTLGLPAVVAVGSAVGAAHAAQRLRRLGLELGGCHRAGRNLRCLFSLGDLDCLNYCGSLNLWSRYVDFVNYSTDGSNFVNYSSRVFGLALGRLGGGFLLGLPQGLRLATSKRYGGGHRCLRRRYAKVIFV